MHGNFDVSLDPSFTYLRSCHLYCFVNVESKFSISQLFMMEIVIELVIANCCNLLGSVVPLETVEAVRGIDCRTRRRTYETLI